MLGGSAQWATPYSDMVPAQLDFEAAGGLVVLV